MKTDLLATATLLAAILTGCGSEEPVYTTRFPAFGTLVDLCIVGANRTRAEHASELIAQDFAFMHRLGMLGSPAPSGASTA